MKFYCLAALLLLSAPSFAMLCPTNFSNINLGDSTDYVKQMCGNPSSQRTYRQSVTGAQDWTYYVKTNAFDKATSKMHVVINDNRVVHINVANNNNSVSNDICQTFGRNANDSQIIQLACAHSANAGSSDVASTNACGATINVGDSAEQVESACGKPVFVNQNEEANAQSSGSDITEFQYDGPPMVTLLFENGSLQDRRQA